MGVLDPLNPPLNHNLDKKKASKGGSANAAEYRLGLTQSAPPPDNGGYIPSNSDVPTDVDYAKMAQQIYDPSFAYLNSAENQARGQNKANDKQLAAMYAALVSSIGADAAGIKGNYNDAINQVAQGGQAAIGAVDRTYDNSASQLANLLRSLGINEAGGKLLGQNASDSSFFQNMLQTASRANQDALTQERAGALEYNTAQKNISRQSGVDARARNMQALQGTLDQIMQNRSQLQTQVNQQALSMQSDAQKSLLDQIKEDHDWQYQQGQLSLGAAKLAADQQNSSNQYDFSKMDPVTALKALATKLYPQGEVAQSNAVKAITDTLARGNGNWMTVQDFVKNVLDRNRGANDSSQLIQLATQFYNNLYGKS